MKEKLSSWTAYLSDGRSINEKDLFVPGEKLPFRKLVEYCKKENLEIQSVTLFINGVRYNSPSLSDRGTFSSPMKPKFFWVCYRDVFFPIQNKSNSFIGLSWAVGDYRTHLWVNLESTISHFEVKGIPNKLEEEIMQLYTG